MTVPTIVAQVVAAVRWLQRRFPHSAVFLGGHSAGAHLAAMAVLTLGEAHGLTGAVDVRPRLGIPSAAG